MKNIRVEFTNERIIPRGGLAVAGEILGKSSIVKKPKPYTIDLKSTEDGYSLYRQVGFQDDNSKYHLMKWKNP